MIGVHLAQARANRANCSAALNQIMLARMRNWLFFHELLCFLLSAMSQIKTN